MLYSPPKWYMRLIWIGLYSVLLCFHLYWIAGSLFLLWWVAASLNIANTLRLYGVPHACVKDYHIVRVILTVAVLPILLFFGRIELFNREFHGQR